MDSGIAFASPAEMSSTFRSLAVGLALASPAAAFAHSTSPGKPAGFAAPARRSCCRPRRSAPGSPPSGRARATSPRRRGSRGGPPSVRTGARALFPLHALLTAMARALPAAPGTERSVPLKPIAAPVTSLAARPPIPSPTTISRRSLYASVWEGAQERLVGRGTRTRHWKLGLAYGLLLSPEARRASAMPACVPQNDCSGISKWTKPR